MATIRTPYSKMSQYNIETLKTQTGIRKYKHLILEKLNWKRMETQRKEKENIRRQT